MDTERETERIGMARKEGNNEEAELSLRCGIGSWTPQWLQRAMNIKIFTINASAVLLFCAAFWKYQSGIVRVLERRFDLTSTQSGFLSTVVDIVQVLTGNIIGYMGGRMHKPRLITCICILTSVGVFMNALPYFIYGPRSLRKSDSVINDNRSSIFRSETQNFQSDLCQPRETPSIDAPADRLEAPVNAYDMGEGYTSYIIFIIACVIGAPSSSAVLILLTPYVYENTSRGDASLYIGWYTHNLKVCLFK